MLKNIIAFLRRRIVDICLPKVVSLPDFFLKIRPFPMKFMLTIYYDQAF